MTGRRLFFYENQQIRLISFTHAQAFRLYPYFTTVPDFMWYAHRTSHRKRGCQTGFHHFLQTKRKKQDTSHCYCHKHQKNTWLQMLPFCTGSRKQQSFLFCTSDCICPQIKKDDFFLPFHAKRHPVFFIIALQLLHETAGENTPLSAVSVIFPIPEPLPVTATVFPKRFPKKGYRSTQICSKMLKS